MAYRRDGPNPLRPYYIPPTIGEPSDLANGSAPNPFSHGDGNATGKYASKARDMFSDIDYKDYISEPSPSVVRTVKDLVDELLWKYTSVLLAQPFEVAKTILQVRGQDDMGGLAILEAQETKARKPPRGDSIYDQYRDSDSDPDEPAYFTSNVPGAPNPLYTPSQRQRTPSPSQSAKVPSKPPLAAHELNLRGPDSILEVVSQLWQKEGGWGVWKATNASFLYNVLQSLLENWSRSLLSALFNVPDLGVKGDVDRLLDIASPYPWASLFVAAAAAVTTGLILSPLDIVRTRLLVTPTSRPSRRTLPILRSLPSYFCPSLVFVPTVLHSLVHPVLTLSTPLVLRTRFMIDRELNPTTFSLAKFCTSSVALFIKLPLETVLRRGQVAVLNTPAYVHAIEPVGKPKIKGADNPVSMETIVQPGRYDGVLGTMRTIVSEEGSRPATKPPTKTKTGSKKGKAKVAETVYRRGQGMEGLWRGWKVSWWGLVGLWAAGVAGAGGDGEF